MIEQIAYNVYILLGAFVILPMALFSMLFMFYITCKEILQNNKDKE